MKAASAADLRNRLNSGPSKLLRYQPSPTCAARPQIPTLPRIRTNDSSPARADEQGHADPRRWPALIVLLLASFMNLIDVTIVNVALPSLQTNMGADPSQVEWVIAAYVLAFALGSLFGCLGDICWRTVMFSIGVAVDACSAFGGGAQY